MSVYVSAPSAVFAGATLNRTLWDAVTAPTQDAAVQVATCAQKQFFAFLVDCTALPAPEGAYDSRCLRIEEAALRGILPLATTAAERYGTGRVGVCVGSCDNGAELSLVAHRHYLAHDTFPAGYTLEQQGASYVATYAARRTGVTGPAVSFATACSSSCGAVIKAAQLIQSGLCDAVIAGGVDVASDTALLGFDALEAISAHKTNPFSRNRSGITLGDGAAFVVLSKEPLGDGPRIVLSGYGESADGYHATSPDPSGRGAAAAMAGALRKAGLRPQDIAYLNLHGTGTRLNDAMEARAVQAVFGTYPVAASSTKSVTGHTLGASSALELAVCHLALERNAGRDTATLPAQVWDGQADGSIPAVNIVDAGNNVVQRKVLHAMSNSFAFGGANGSLILSLEDAA